MTLLVISEILELFVKTLIANDEYFLHTGENLSQPVQMQLSNKQEVFSQFSAEFFKCTWNFEHLITYMGLIGYVFPKL